MNMSLITIQEWIFVLEPPPPWMHPSQDTQLQLHALISQNHALTPLQLIFGSVTSSSATEKTNNSIKLDVSALMILRGLLADFA